MKNVSKSTVGLILSALAFVSFAAFVRNIPHSGVPAMMLAEKLGLNPTPSFQNPIYGWVVQLLAAISGDALYFTINLFSAVCIAAVIGLVFAFVYSFTPRFNVENSLTDGQMRRIQIFSGIVAVLYLLAAAPVWMAATRATPLPFDLLLMLSAFYLVVTYTGQSRSSRMMLAVFIYGVAIVEFTTAIIFAPLFGVLVIAMLYSTGNMRPGIFLKLIGCGVLGLLFYLVQAWLYTLTPTYAWREFKHIFQVVWYIWLEQYQTLVGRLPRVGWLTLSLVCVLPWIVTYTMNFSRKLGLASGAIFGRIVLQIILLVLAVVLLLDVPLAPMAITGTTLLYVTPYVLIALWVGNVAAFWAVALSRPIRFERPWAFRGRTILGYVFFALLPVFLIVRTAVYAAPRADTRNEQLVQHAAEAIVDATSDDRWLISNTMLDDHIALEIKRRDAPINFIRAGFTRSKVYMKYIAAKFTDRPRLESLALIGFGPFVEEWLPGDPSVDGGIAIVNIPELWLAAGSEAVPDRLVSREWHNQTNELDAVLSLANVFWENLGAEIASAEADDDIPGNLVRWLKIHLSKQANNLGVMLEDAGRSDDAMACYEQSRRFEPENLSALMNLHVLSEREQRPGFDALDKELQEKTKNIMGKVQAMSLSQIYGYVRVPDLFVRRGMTFALSGKPDMAVSELKRALALREGSSQLQLALAGLFFQQQQDVQSREYYLQVLAENPGQQQALLGLMRLASRSGDFVEARRLLDALKDAGAPEGMVKIEGALIEALSGASAKAMRLLQEVVKVDDKNVMAWTALAAIATELGDTKVAEDAINKLKADKVFSPGLNLVMAQAALGKKDRDNARLYIEDVLRRQPGYIPALEMLLRLDLSIGARDAVQQTVERILNIDPGNALANYMLGVYHYYREEYLLAEAAYRASLATLKTPEALNDLAYILYLLKRYEDAEPLIRESLMMNNRNPAAWDTLGVVLMAENKLDEAQQALQQSLAIRPNTAGVLLNLALLYEKLNQSKECETIARDINARQNELSPEQQLSIRELIRRLDAPQ